MGNLVNRLKGYWMQRDQMPNGVWILLLSYSLVAFGSPMPPRITWLEILIGSGLLIGSAMLAGNVIQQLRENAASKWMLGLLLALLILPTCVGLVHGNTWGNIARDIFPVIFLVSIPILLIHSRTTSNRAMLSTIATATVIFVGVVTAIIFFTKVIQTYGTIGNMVEGGLRYIQALQGAEAVQSNQADFYIRELFLKPYDPAMLFAAIFISAWGVVLAAKSQRAWLLGWILIGFGSLIAYAFMALGLRAYSALYVVSMGVVALTLYRERGLYVRLLPLIIVGAIMYWSQIEGVINLLWYKHQMTGFNGKASEWVRVIDTISSSPQALIFGTGWGGVLANPIYQDGETRYTHSIISFFLYKSGMLGLGVALCVMATLLHKVLSKDHGTRIERSEQILVISCLSPLAIGVLFEPTYKTLSFGVILALLILAIPSRKNCRQGV